jgi:hypothetical protein
MAPVRPLRQPRHAADELTEAMDRVCADVQTAKDEFVSRTAARVLEKVEW